MKKIILITFAMLFVFATINAQDAKDKTNVKGKYNQLVTKVEFKGKDFKDARKEFKRKYDMGYQKARNIGGVDVPAGYWVYMKEGMPQVVSQNGNTTNVSVGVGDVVQMGKAMAKTPVLYVWGNAPIPEPSNSSNTNTSKGKNTETNTAKTKIAASETGEVKDSRDGEVYKTIKIGDQWWFAENLRYDAKDNSRHANDDAGNDKTFGKLYKAKYVTENKNVCPNGWHVPSDEDWAKFESYLGIPEKDLQKNGSAEARGRDQFAGAHLKDNKDLGFNALPAGKHGGNYSDGFIDYGKYAYFWTTTKSLDQRELTARTVGFSEYTQGIGRKITPLSTNPSFSVRCVKDGSATYTKQENNSAKLKVTVKAEGGNSPAKNVNTYLYKSKSDCENSRNHVAVKTTNANGEVIFENLTVGEFYYVKAEKTEYSVKKETNCTSTMRITDKYENRLKISFY